MAKRVMELEHRRGRFWRSWLRDDGLTEVVVTLHPQCFKRGDQWLPIDTRFKYQKRAESDYEVRDADYRFRPARFADGWHEYRVGDAVVRWRFKGAAHVRANVPGDTVTYPAAFPKADLVFRAREDGVKEEIVLWSPEAPKVYEIEFEAEGCEVRQTTDGALEWLVPGQGEPAFVMHRPVAQDAEGDPEQAGTVLHGPTWTVFLRDSWVSSPDRQWPIRLDPTTVTVNPSGDAYVDANYPSTNYGTATDLYFISGCCYPYLVWSLPTLPAGATLQSATIKLWISGYNASGSTTVWIWRVTSSWSESTVTYNTRPTIDSTASASVSGTVYDFTSYPYGSWWEFNVLSLVSGWYQGTYPNYGVHVSAGLNIKTPSRENASNKPQLIITYNSPPSAPTNLSPGGTSASPAVINTVTPTLTWTHNDPDGDAQASFQLLIYRASDNVLIKDTGEVVSSTSTYAVPAATLAEGVTYYWRVRTKDGAGAWGPYSSDAYIYTNRAPSASPTSPVGTATNPAIVANTTTPRLAWSYSDPDGHAQGKYRVVYYRASDNLLIRDTGWVASANAYYDVPAGDLAYGTTYYWQVQVEDAYGRQSALTSAQYFQPNQTPNAPTGLSPGGTSTDPAEINTLTPTLTWVHSDPEGDPQQSFQVLIYRASDNALIHDSGEVVSGTSSYAVPSGVLSGSVKYYWRVRTKDTVSLLFGPYSADAHIYTNQAPYAPTNLSPSSGAVFDATTVKRFSWTFQDPDVTPNGDAQSAFQVLIYRVSDGVLVHDSGKVISGNQYYDLAANTLVNGVDYQWKVCTWDLQDQPGPYSSLASFRTGHPPTVSITSPADAGTYGKGIFTVQWSYSDPDTDPQVQYQAVLKTGAGAVIEDSGVIASAATQHQFATILSNNTQYQVTVAVWDATGQTATDTNTFTTSFVPPTTPVLGLVADDVGDKIVLTITNPDDDPAKPATDRNDLYRRKQGEAGWIRIAKGLPKNGGYDDYTVASGAVYEYKVVAISVDETTAESAVQSGGVSFLGVWLHDPADPANTARHFLYDGRAREEVWEPEAELLQFAGRALPVAEFGQQTDERVRVTLQLLKSSGDLEVLRALARRRKVLCYRDGAGRKVFGVMTALPVSEQPYGAEVTVEVISVAYSEAV